jgi:hypothetical protein
MGQMRCQYLGTQNLTYLPVLTLAGGPEERAPLNHCVNPVVRPSLLYC